MAFTSPSGAFGSIVPSQVQQALATNYLTFDSASGGGTFAKQYLPEIYENEVERYGNRTLSGFLRMVGAEMPMASDQVIWSEQNRLHIAYTGVEVDSAAGNTLVIPVDLTPANPNDFVQNVISINQTIVILDPATGLEVKAIVTASDPITGDLTVAPYTAATLAAAGFTDGQEDLKIFVYGSEYKKGSTLVNDDYVSIEPSFTQFSNSPIIIRNKYVVNGSDTAQIGWVEIATEDGAIEKFINNIPRIYYPTETELDALFKAYEDGSMPGMMTVDSGEKWAKAFPTLTRNTCAEIVRVIANWDGSPKIPVRLDKDFEDDALYCEAVYVVDLDNKTFTSKWDRNMKTGEWQFIVTLTFDEVKEMKVAEYHARFKQEVLV